METLQEFIAKHDEIKDIVDRIGASGANGVNTLADRIVNTKDRIDKNDYTYTNFHSLFDDFNRQRLEESEIRDLETNFNAFKQELPEIREKLTFNFIENFTKSFEKDDFVDQWNSLNEEQKSNILYIDKEMYKIIRQKIDVSEFNFLFKSDNQFDGGYPIDIAEWMHASSLSKIKFFQLRKAAQGDIHEDFFNSQEVKDAESKDSKTRQKIAINYLVERKRLHDNGACWYDRLDMLIERNFSLTYTYGFFKNLEDEFNGYDTIKKNAKLPDILKKWSGEMFDKELYTQEWKILNKEMEGKTPEESSKIYKNRHKNYPTITLAESMQGGLKKEEFLALVKESKGTEFEEFFNSSMTQKMHHDMPYKRIDYMFIYFREKFTNETKRKPKFN